MSKNTLSGDAVQRLRQARRYLESEETGAADYELRIFNQQLREVCNLETISANDADAIAKINSALEKLSNS